MRGGLLLGLLGGACVGVGDAMLRDWRYRTGQRMVWEREQVYACMYVCVYTYGVTGVWERDYVYVCVYVCMYVRVCVWCNGSVGERTCICMYVCVYACGVGDAMLRDWRYRTGQRMVWEREHVYVCMCVCMYVCMCVCMRVV
jgi:hypothetical protein